MENTFIQDLSFLEQHTEVVELISEDGQSRVVLVPAWQGRVMTSTSGGSDGRSYGWINYPLIESGEKQEQIHAYGGEDRFWMGPEGGQFSIFFKPGDAFDFTNWKTPACIDTEPYPIFNKSLASVVFRKDTELTNYAGTRFNIQIMRMVTLLNQENIADNLGITLPEGIQYVGYESVNELKNMGDPWSKETGLLSVWILGMYRPSDHTTLIVPFKPATDAASLINDSYFGKIAPDRLDIRDGSLLMKADGKSRGKIGIPPEIVLPVAGSYNKEKNILTLVQFNYENDVDYVNSMWEIQEHPYRGDVVNAYNDGPLDESGAQLGPFYELETSSPAIELQTGKKITHIHRTYHFEGNYDALNSIAREVLGVDLNDLKDF